MQFTITKNSKNMKLIYFFVISLLLCGCLSSQEHVECNVPQDTMDEHAKTAINEKWTPKTQAEQEFREQKEAVEKSYELLQTPSDKMHLPANDEKGLRTQMKSNYFPSSPYKY